MEESTLYAALKVYLAQLPVDQRIQLGILVAIVAQGIVAGVGLMILLRQTSLLLTEMRKTSVRHMYDRWTEINKFEVSHPELHRMLMPPDTYQELAEQLSDDEIKTRALSLLVFDQFSMMYHSGEKATIWDNADNVVRPLCRALRLEAWWDVLRDRHRSLIDINREYIADVISNPIVRRCWRDWRLGETWKGTRMGRELDRMVRESMQQETEIPQTGPRTEAAGAQGERGRMRGGELDAVQDRQQNAATMTQGRPGTGGSGNRVCDEDKQLVPEARIGVACAEAAGPRSLRMAQLLSRFAAAVLGALFGRGRTGVKEGSVGAFWEHPLP